LLGNATEGIEFYLIQTREKAREVEIKKQRSRKTYIYDIADGSCVALRRGSWSFPNKLGNRASRAPEGAKKAGHKRFGGNP